MADIKLRIEVNPNANSEIIGNIISDNNEIANTSIFVDEQNKYVNIPTDNTSISGSNGITWAYDYLVFNENDELDNVENSQGYLESETKPQEFFWGIVPNNKEYSVKLIFQNATDLKDIVVYGDKANNQFPTEAVIDGETTIYGDDNEWLVNFLHESDTHTIEFTKWNRANYNACVTLIAVLKGVIDFDKFNGLKSVESLSQSTSSPQDVFYGVLPNSGSVELFDINGELLDLSKEQELGTAKAPVSVFIDDVKVQSHISTDSDYDNNTKILNISLGDPLSFWDEIQYAGYPFPYDGNSPDISGQSAYFLLSSVLMSVGYSQIDIDKMLDTQIVYGSENEKGTIKDYLQSINIKYPVLQKDSVRNTIEKFCRLAQLQVFRNDDGEIKFISARPIATKEEVDRAVVVGKKNINGLFSKSIILKNKYQNINVDYQNVIDDIDYDTVLFTHNIDVTPQFRYANSKSETSSDYSLSPVKIERIVSRIETYSVSGNVSFPKKTNMNLSQIQVVYKGYDDNGENYTKHGQYYTLKTLSDGVYNYNSTNIIQSDLTQASLDNSQPLNIDNFGFVFDEDYSTQKITRASSSVASQGSADLGSISLSDSFEAIFNITEDENNVYCSYEVLCGKLELGFNELVYYFVDEKSVAIKDYGIDLKKYMAKQLSITFYGDKRDISFETTTNNQEDVKDNASVSVTDSELLQNNTMIVNRLARDVIYSNIKNDYSNGVSTATVSVVCMDYFNKNGEKIKDWGKGEILQVGELIMIDIDGSSLWRITGRNFRKVGVPLVDLELQEVVQIV